VAIAVQVEWLDNKAGNRVMVVEIEMVIAITTVAAATTKIVMVMATTKQ